MLLPQEMRELAALEKQAVLLGSGNKIDIWNADQWRAERDNWLADVGDDTSSPSAALDALSL